MKTIYLLLGIFFLCPALVFSQGEMTPQDSEDAVQTRKIKHFSVGAKAGSPIGLGFGGEIVIPILGNRIAPYVDFSNLNDLVLDDVTLGHQYLEYGLNIYFSNQARGVYLGVGMISTTTDLAYADQVSDMGRTFVGLATTSLELDLINVKLGIKTGGTLYFRFEVGYGLGDIPQELVVTGTTEFMGMTQMETTTEEIPEIPGIAENGMPTVNIGLGLSF